MTENQWLRMRQPGSLWVAVMDKRNARKHRLFSCACCRRVEHLITDERIRGGIEVAEDFADSRATRAQLNNAYRRILRVMNAFPRLAPGAPEDPQRLAISAVYAVTSFGFHNIVGASMRASRACWAIRHGLGKTEEAVQADIFRDIFGNPFRPVTFDKKWRTDTAVSLARAMYDSRDFSAMPILADALQEADCDNDVILNHCRDTKQVHARGCWVVDLVLGKS